MRVPAALISAAVLLASPVAGQVAHRPVEPGGAFRSVITLEELREYGVQRLSDVLRLIDGWSSVSVDGFTWRSAPRGLSTYDEARYLVMIDDQALNLDLFGIRSLNRIPIALSQIDSIEVISVPGYVSGELGDAGVLRIHTRDSPPGPSLGVLGFTANETGDPGPYRFTELATPNVDRLGSGVSGALSYGWDRSTLDLSGVWQEHFVTDPPLRGRNFDITTGDYPIIEQGGASLILGMRTPTGDHRLLLAHSRTRDYYLLPPFGREVPVRSPFTHAGVSGGFRLGGPARIEYRASFDRNQLDREENALGLDFDWEMDRWRADASLSSRIGDRPLSLTVGVERTVATTGYGLTDDDFYVGSARGRLGYRLDARQSGSVALQVATAGDRPVLRAAVTYRLALDSTQTLEAVVSHLERLPEEDTRIWIWRSRGYGFLSDNGVQITGNGGPGKTRVLAVDLRWSRRFASGLSASLGGYARRMSGLLLEEQDYSYDPITQSFGGPVRLLPDREGTVLGGELGLEWSAAERASTRVYYGYRHTVAGDAAFEREWDTVPSHRVSLQASYDPWRTVRLRGSVRYRGATIWHDYAASEEQTGGAYTFAVPDRLLVDVSAQKWFWRRRLRLHIMVRDLLDQEKPLHPIGAAHGLSFLVQGELRMGGLSRRSSER